LFQQNGPEPFGPEGGRSTPKHLRQTLETEHLSIRFVNTVAWRLREPHEERLGSPTVLLDWLERNGLARTKDLRLVRKVWGANPRRAHRVYKTAIQLREAMYDLFAAHIARRRPSPSALSFFGQFLWGSSSRLRFEWEAGRLEWRMTPGAPEPLELLRPIALSAAELMTGTRAHKIRQCQDDRGCGWLFVDQSRLQNRRWCSMGDCGNRAKARSHRERIRAGIRRGEI
jgi:predicted RNA-binding Zn ribbon-like protein